MRTWYSLHVVKPVWPHHSCPIAVSRSTSSHYLTSPFVPHPPLPRLAHWPVTTFCTISQHPVTSPGHSSFLPRRREAPRPADQLVEMRSARIHCPPAPGLNRLSVGEWHPNLLCAHLIHVAGVISLWIVDDACLVAVWSLYICLVGLLETCLQSLKRFIPSH